MPNYTGAFSQFNMPEAAPITPYGVGDRLGASFGNTGMLSGLGDEASIANSIDKFTSQAGKFGTKDYINAGLTGVQTIGGLIGAFGSLSLANKQYAMQKKMNETNLTNQVGAYNTSLDDKARSRAVLEGQSDATRDAYIKEHQATTGL